MARWISKITNAGLTLLARTPNNNFVFTKAECGSGTVNAAVLETQTQVTNFKKLLLISGCTSTNNKVSLRVQLNNENISTGFLLHQIGIYAKLATDSTDILFMILQTDLADFIPSVTESPNYVCDYVVNTVISNASSITANVDPAGYVTQGQLEEILAGLEDVELKDNVEQIKQEIGATNDVQSSSTTTGSIFAKLNYLVSQVSSYLSSAYNNCLKIGNTEDVTNQTLFGKIKTDINNTIGTENFKPLNEIVIENTKHLINKVQSINAPKKNIHIFNDHTITSLTTSVSGLTDATNRSKIIGTFTVNENQPVNTVEINCTVRSNSSSSVTCRMFVTTLSDSTLLADLNTSNVFSGSVSATSNTSVLITGAFFAEKGVSYYVHILPQASYFMYCDSCSISYDLVSCLEVFVNEEVSAYSNNTTAKNSVVLGTFNFSSIPDGVPILVKFKCMLKGTSGMLAITKYSPQSESYTVLNSDSLKKIAPATNDFAYYEATISVNNKDTYYIHLVGTSSKYIYCNSCYMVFEENKTVNSSIISVQNGCVSSAVNASGSIKVDISPVNPEKCTVSLNSVGGVNYVLKHDSLTLINIATSASTIGWEITEHL